MRIMHLSDNHGQFPKIPGVYDIVLCTGDFFPNSHHLFSGAIDKEIKFQLNWLRDSMSDIVQWLNGHPFLFVLGNHDFLPPDVMEKELQSYVEAFDLTDKIVSYQNVNFYGFPYVPSINGRWNYERNIMEMQDEVDKMVNVLNSTYVDVLACHSPPANTLDLTYSNQRIGSTVIANALDYKISRDMLPQIMLFGHCHEANGIAMRDGVLCSNAATTQSIIEL